MSWKSPEPAREDNSPTFGDLSLVEDVTDYHNSPTTKKRGGLGEEHSRRASEREREGGILQSFFGDNSIFLWHITKFFTLNEII
jgi:hypothetical protein